MTFWFQNFSNFLDRIGFSSKKIWYKKSIGFSIVQFLGMVTHCFSDLAKYIYNILSFILLSVRNMFFLNLVSSSELKSVLDSVLNKFGIKKYRIRYRSDFGYHHTLFLRSCKIYFPYIVIHI